jgi:MATE family multidrug resistance protein
MGRIGTVAIASHQVAINVAATLFMVPLGISVAATTRVGQFAGAGRMADAARAGWTSIGLAIGFNAFTAILLLLLHDHVASLYTTDPAVVAGAGTLLMIAGAFQISDGLQVSALGALRGLKDTTRPMIVNIVSYWLVALPAAWLLGFELNMKGPGLWWGLTLGLTVAGFMHATRFRRLVGGSWRGTEPAADGGTA